MRMPFVAANWKMYKSVGDALAYCQTLKGALPPDLEDVEVVLAPPFTALHAVAEATRDSVIEVAGQDLYWEREGAFTGEISGPMLKEAGAAYVIVGHSERRTLFGETDETVNRKTMAALAAELTPIVCIGETLNQREGQETMAVLDRQIQRGFEGLSGGQMAGLVVAYEPVWAIGTGRNATAAQAEEAHAHIRQRIGQWFGQDAADRVHVIYGGSVKPGNIAELIAQPNVDGALVGGASLDAGAFQQIVVACQGKRV